MSDEADHLRRLIAHKGPLSLAEFMTEALWHPSEGYYARSDVLGRSGDYTTAPEISQMFGELLGLWAGSAWEAMGRPAAVRLVELGPGRGTLLADALRAARLVPGFLAAIELHLVEASPRLQATQAATLARYAPHWQAHFAAVPQGPFILLANEFFDALPILQLERTAAGWFERLVACDEVRERFRFVLARQAAPAARLLPAALVSAPLGSVAEISPAAISLVAMIAARLVAHGGAALLIDYGPAESQARATLQALRRHHPHDPLEAPGTADLTAHVDFAALARAAREAGAAVHGPIEQGTFLARLGITARAERLAAAATGAQPAAIRSGLRRLIDEREMGTLFKALALTDPQLPTLAGFERSCAKEMR